MTAKLKIEKGVEKAIRSSCERCVFSEPVGKYIRGVAMCGNRKAEHYKHLFFIGHPRCKDWAKKPYEEDED